ncbi:50S ribosomal protein L4 [Candidatus Peregrinibacteria bacterium CG10_big_fil_rev_8_21_14_0_10_49_16]|nr:MAG: 50S ribosomal protein L4 [Candidatus Peregrinibacteria bacterium CG22_combo_CG10-13_8_21_14_all_49_11]PIR51824.1 MAG: 50S ribosomal protein L4 [Candidatus Peregrinibacteria bacterium CG10_big_fil_rev_8_21_14_0_10_49_16]
MNIDVYTSTGTKKGSSLLPSSVFEAVINEGLMHQALVRQQSNRRRSTAHTKSRGEVQGSTRKLYQQKGTGQARRGSIRSPLLRGGGKAFGSKKNRNYNKDMPKSMRRAALRSCLSLQAKNGNILGLDAYPDQVKTKVVFTLLQKLPVTIGRQILFVTADKHTALSRSARNIPRVKTVIAAYLNPEDVLGARHIIFLTDALKKTEEVFGQRKEAPAVTKAPAGKKEAPEKKERKKAKKTPSKASAS